MLPLSPPTRTFLRDVVRSLLQLDVLFLLFRDDRRWWNAEQLVEELKAPQLAVSTALEELAASNLLDVRIGSTLTYRFAPVEAASRAAVGEAAARPDDARDAVTEDPAPSSA
jgi:hypothetical protein